ncbi:ACP S-malonyltransferase [Clostridium oryzae]|uniref:Malonyl CoA-acyl carrier protein transacylase n=1 Tax=Clostridium oryzae TaxID=1450648 RepID=A0A1V4IU92_9CLOT|nr:ACP S-malonyltransferase [Clostridium oryzae]OPJ63608.1 malonyl CoA-acyl carrier protein transacylase [Clostridium oryzae]
MGKILFMFPGQGAQYVGMGKELSENFKECRLLFEEADEALGYSLSDICFNGPEDRLNLTEVTQPAVYATSMAALKALEVSGIFGDMTAGFSLGEYSALTYSGVLNFKDTVKLVGNRGRYMQEAVPVGIGKMAAVIGLETDKVIEICKQVSEFGVAEPVNFNCPGQIVIAGEVLPLEKAEKIVVDNGGRYVSLKVSAPFHSSMLKSAAKRLRIDLDKIDVNPIKIPVLTDVTANYIKSHNDVRDILEKQAMSPVLWQNIIERTIEDGADTFIEIGPGKALSSFAKKINRKAKIFNVQDLKGLKNAVEGLK